MEQDRCRVCGSEFWKEPLMEFFNMPKSAQYMPSFSELSEDKGIDLKVVQCKKCGLVQLTNEPVPYYREVIRAVSFSEKMKGFRRRQFREFFERYRLQGKKIIEIGCGDGGYLSLLHELDAQVFGTEYNEELVEGCRRKGLKVVRDFPGDKGRKLDEGPFDAFCIFNFFEHLPNPREVLDIIYENLKEDAFGIIEVPNFEMMVRESLFSEFVADHLMYFTKDTLRFTLEQSGFELIELSELWDEYIISARVRKRKKVELKSHLEGLKREILDYVRSQVHRNISIWGAGHQALFMTAYCRLQNYVRFVIDSAKFKQGKFTQATHIPIIAPLEIEERKIGAILVMGAGYTDEIIKIIREEHPSVEHIAALRKHTVEILYDQEKI